MEQKSSDSESMTKPPFKSGYVAIVGRPNVGKSTLLNHVLQFKISSVTRKPQTTRHQIRGILNGENYQVVFLDTPGLLHPKYKLQEAMLRASHRALQDADLTLFLVEAGPKPNPPDLETLAEVQKMASRLILVINKVDLVRKEEILPTIQFFYERHGLECIVPVSALKSDGLDELTQAIVSMLPVGLPFYSREQMTDHPERFLVAEIIREKIFLKYGDEIPYSTTVAIDEFKERGKHKDFIRATIYVERNSQKGILIGKKGSALKGIGLLARDDIEELLGRSVFLELWVRVKEKWRQNELLLKEFGYGK